MASGTPPPVLFLRPSDVTTRERAAALLGQLVGHLEDGLKAIGANIQCHPCGEIDLLALDRANHLTVIDFDTVSNDGLLLRGLSHVEWLLRNGSNVQRLFPKHPIDPSAAPRLFLLAPQFSPVVRSVIPRVSRPAINWVRYHLVDISGSPGVLFEPIVAD